MCVRDVCACVLCPPTGTCYLNSDSETCGDPLCGQMVLSIQGNTRFVEAYISLDFAEYRRMEASRADDSRNSRVQKAAEQFVAKLRNNRATAGHKATAGVPNKKGSRQPTNTGEKLYYKGIAWVYTGPVRVR